MKLLLTDAMVNKAVDEIRNSGTLEYENLVDAYLMRQVIFEALSCDGSLEVECETPAYPESQIDGPSFYVLADGGF